jgi:hypothetical protein
MAIPVIDNWRNYFHTEDEGLGSSYERVILNQLLTRICQKYEIQKVLEAPLFGFTGISGINSMNMAREGKEITLIDDNSERLVMIEKLWKECKFPVNLLYSENFLSLPTDDNEFDMSWNFSALWFVQNLESFLTELDRITKRVILIIVPNRTGPGFILQKIMGKKRYNKFVNLSWIKFSRFSRIMNSLGWQLIEERLIDCPPWPDIGMKKELFAKKLCLGFLLDKDVDETEGASIMSYYRGKDEDFPQRMLKYNRLEQLLPEILKRFWAHHHYYLYIRKPVSS